MSSQSKSKGPVDQLLGVFADVRAGEGLTAILLTVNVFILLALYYVIKPVREALILADGSAELKSYTSAMMAVLFVFLVPAYSRLAERVPRRRLINVVTMIFVACMVLFYLLALAEVSLGIVFYVWVGIFNMMIIAQFWSFANDVYTKDQGERLFAIVAFGASAGAVLGGMLAKLLIPLFDTVYPLLLVSAALLAGSLVLTNTVDRRESGKKKDDAGQTSAEPEMGKDGAFALLLQNKYLLLIAILLLLLNWTNTTGEYILGKVVAATVAEGMPAGLDEAAQKAYMGKNIGAFYADFFTIVNIVGMVVQAFLVSRIIKYLGVPVALLFLPIIAFGAYGLLAFYPMLSVVRWAKTAENSIDYSLNNTVRQALFLPTTREEKYKAKQAIDTFFVRAGDVLSSVLVFVGVTYLSFEPTHFAMFNLVLVGCWIVVAIEIGRRYRELVAQKSASESA